MVSQTESTVPNAEDGDASRGGLDPGRLRQSRLTLWFYVGVPLALGFLLGWLQVGRAADWPRQVSLLYWVGVSLATTALSALATAAIAPLLRRMHSPLWLTLVCGQILAGFVFVDPALQAYRGWLQETLHAGILLTPASTLTEFLQRLPSNALLWLGVNLAFFHGLGMPRFGYVPARARSPEPAAQAAAPAPPQVAAQVAASDGGSPVRDASPVRDTAPPFMSRVRPERRGALLALEAEGHYLRVHTDSGSDLILYRLSDAIDELDPADGARVHRSWWVADRAVSGNRERDLLSLRNGLRVPVSRSYRVAARQRGWLGAGYGA